MADKPVIFISYSHLDEPEKPGPDEVKWLTFVRKFLRPLERHGILRIWDDQKIRAGSGWREEIEKQLDGCDICVLLVSPNSLASDFILDDEVKTILERRRNEGVEVYPIVITPTPLKGAEWLTEMQLRPGKTKALSLYPLHEREARMVTIVEEIVEMLEGMTRTGRRAVRSGQSSTDIPDLIDIEHLPLTPYKKLVGRDDELEALDAAWGDDLTNIVSLIAWGGAGKTALINEWLKRLQADNYRSASAVLGWSFYDQGTKERTTAADQFLDWSLSKLGVKVDAPSATVKGERLAEALAKRRVLLVLDGVEPLQHGPGGQEGLLKDQGLRILLRRFAATPPASVHGLLIVVSRIAVRDIDQYRRAADKKGSCDVIDLSSLRDSAGAALLADNGVKGSQTELMAASREFEGHALALSLLASLLVRRHSGDIRRRDRVGPLLQRTTTRGHDHARRVMQAYEAEWLDEEPVLKAILCLVGLFDRPATADCIDALRRQPMLEGLAEPLAALAPDSWADAVAALRDVRLLDPEDVAAPGSLDTHPLVREWFGERLREANGRVWGEAHARLYEHLRDSTKEGVRPNLEKLAPLYQAISHGCQAGRHQEALDEIFKARICRKRVDGRMDYYSIYKLGAISSDLAAISWLFERPFDLPISSLDPKEQSWVLGIAAFRLFAQGRLVEALSVQRARLRLEVDAERWLDASISARSVSAYELSTGRIADATMLAQEAFDYAEKSGDLEEVIDSLSDLGSAFHEAGEKSKSQHFLAEAELRLQKISPTRPLLRSVGGYTICDALLASARWDEARKRANRALVWVLSTGDLLPMALQSLVLGRAYHGLALERSLAAGRMVAARADAHMAKSWFDKALDRLHAANRITRVARGYVDRAAFFRSAGDWKGAALDLDEVEEIAEPGLMKLHLCDMALGRARLAFAKIEAFAPLKGMLEKDNPAKPEVLRAEEITRLRGEADKQLKIAADYIETCGYHRRDEELAELQAVLRGERKFAELPPRV